MQNGAHAITFGGEIRAHDGHHIGTVISGSGLPPGTEADHVYYDYHPRTLSAGVFAREEWTPRPMWAWTLDLAWRHQGYFMRDDRYDGVRFDQSYDFFLPRLGVRWNPTGSLALFAAAGHARREPAFRDLYDGEGVGSVPLIVNGEPLIKPERVNDYELGVSWWNLASRGSRPLRTSLSANLFRMDFRDELVYAGQFNTDLGYPILGNAARSIHQGIELAGSMTYRHRTLDSPRTEPPSYPPDAPFGSGTHPDFAFDANTTISDNHFIDYTEHYGPTPADDVSYDGNAIGFFPATMANVGVRGGWRGATLGLVTQMTGRIYLDNTESKDASIGPRAVLDLNGAYRFPFPSGGAAAAVLRVFNVLDRRYATSGYMDYDSGGNLVPQFIPAATRHWLGELRLEF